MSPRYRIFPFDKSVTVHFVITVTMGCGCVYDKYERDGADWDTGYPRLGRYLRRYRCRCAAHALMCRNLERWELED